MVSQPFKHFILHVAYLQVDFANHLQTHYKTRSQNIEIVSLPFYCSSCTGMKRAGAYTIDVTFYNH